MPAGRLEVASRAGHRGGVDVGGVQLDAARFGAAQGGGDREAERASAAAQIDDHGPGRLVSQRDGGVDQELAAAAGNEHPGVHEDPQAVELGPPDHLLERQAADPPLDQRVEFGRAARGLCEQPGLILREHAAGGAQPRHDGLVGSHKADYAYRRPGPVILISGGTGLTVPP